MTIKLVNQAPFIRTSRQFPTEAQALSVELDRSYLDIAATINDRVIGLFPTVKAAQTGETWFLSKNQKQYSFREVYQFSDGNLTIPHGLNLQSITNFTRIFGSFYTGSLWVGLPYVDVTSATNQVTVTIDATNINIVKGSGAPAIQNGIVVIEWITNP